MAGNNLSVKITADIVDLQTKFALAKAQVSGLSSELNRLAKASVNGGIDPAGAAQLQQLAGDLVQAKSVASGLSGAMRTAGEGTSMFGRSAEAAGEHSATAVRYVRELFDEISSGRTRYLPSTLAALGQSALHMNFAMLASVGAVGGLAAALGYLAIKAVEASHQLDAMHLNALRSGSDVTREQIQQLADELQKLPSVSSSSASTIVGALSKLPLPFEAMTAAARIAGEEMQQTRASAQQVGEEMAKALAPARSALDVAKDTEGVTQAQVDAAEAADKSGNANAVLAEKLSLLAAPLARARQDVDEYRISLGQAATDAVTLYGQSMANLYAPAAGLKAQNPLKVVAEQSEAAWNANAAAIRAAISAVQNMPAVKPVDFSDKDATEQLALQKEVTQAAQQASQVRSQMAQAEFAQESSYLEQLAAVQQAVAQQSIQAAQDASQIRSQAAQEEFQKDSSYLKQYAQAANRAAQQDASSWRGAVSEIEGAEDQMVRSLIGGRQSLSQSLLKISANLAEREIENDLRSVTQQIASHLMGAAATKGIDQEGLLYHLATELQKTTSTAVSQAAQTSATVAGNAARLASTTSTALAAKATSSALGASTVAADAAKAYSGTYASVSQIPYVGWILAPAAAAAAYAAVAAYKGLASLDVGAWSVPHDMVAQIHKGESVVPTSFAQGLRQTGALGGAAGAGATGAAGAGGGDTYQVFISAIDGQSVNRYIQQASPQLRQTLRTLVRGNARAGTR